MSSQTDLQREITNRIIEALKNGVAPWRKPWSDDPNSGAPKNVVSHRNYSGINPVLLNMTALNRGFKSCFWGTYRQWQELGAQVKKRPKGVKEGQWGTTVVFYKQVRRNKEIDGETVIESFPILRSYTVFNLDQVDGDKLDHLRPIAGANTTPGFADYSGAGEVIDATGAEFRLGGNKAFYVRPVGKWPNHTDGDFICMPFRDQFCSLSEFYQTAFHEICHWSEVRLGWVGSYAMGELIAEIGSAFIANQLNIPAASDLSNHAAYVGQWLKDLEDDPRTILRAASQASKAAEFILSFCHEPEPEHENAV
jgi:antirestriction protein ArdC